MTRDLPHRLHPLCQGDRVKRTAVARRALAAVAVVLALLSPTASSPAAGADGLPAFRFTVRTIDADLALTEQGVTFERNVRAVSASSAVLERNQ